MVTVLSFTTVNGIVSNFKIVQKMSGQLGTLHTFVNKFENAITN